MRRRLFIGVLALIAAAPLVSLRPASSETDSAQFKILGRWATDNTTLRPVTFDGNVLFVAGETTLEAWDIKSGERLWKQPLDVAADFRPRLAGDKILAVGRTFISAWDRKTGEKRWSYRPKHPIGAPTYHDNRIFLGVGHFMTSLDAATGKVLWSRPEQENKGIWYSPTHFGKDAVLFGTGGGYLYSLAPDTGEVRWKINQAKKWQYLRQHHISGATLVAGGYKDNIFGIDAATGNVKWNWYSGNFINSHLVYDGAAYLWSPTGWVYALDAKTGAINWRAKSDYFPRKNAKKTPWAPVMAELVADDKGLYVLDMKNVLHIIDHDSGKEITAINFGERLRPFMALSPGTRRLFLGNTKGEILYVELTDPKAL